MSSKRAKGYLVEGSTDEGNIETLTENIEQSVRRIQCCPVLSDDWLVVATEIERLSHLSALEENTNSNQAQNEEGMKMLGKSGNETLWDTKNHIETLKALVEQAKCNVLIRLIKEYKEWTRLPSAPQEVQNCVARHHREYDEIISKLNQFEFDLGLLLKRLFEHAETLQISDIPLLLEHINFILRGIIDRAASLEHLDLRQESLVFFYLYSIFKAIEQLNEEQIVHWSKEHELPRLLVIILVDFHSIYSEGCKTKLLEALGAMSDVDSFFSNDYDFADAHYKQELINLKKGMIRDLIVEHPEKRPGIRPFLDLIDKYERDIRFPKRK
ncbi:unnamed protein product [Blepharisma stoltei]|uniref:Uncharacterized protein n=1 Tax=Blepharisma stoltei TaxID=1481888 RepID=A0AAU9K4Q9_9CILI|nr:unnamed protein product [Blepharisma stoltei]